MGSLEIAANVVFRRSELRNSLSTVAQSSPGASSLPNRSICSVRKGRCDRQVFANAKQCVERNAETSSNGVMHVSNGTRSSFTKVMESEIAVGERYQELLKRSGLALRARETFVLTGDITEVDMERLVESLVNEEGQSMEDYRQRAIVFQKIAEFFSQGRNYSSTPHEISWTGTTEIARTMQVIVDVVLAGDGRSATDYNHRAQLFAKSAEVFPFTSEVR